MRVYDITRILNRDIPFVEGDPHIEITPARTMEKDRVRQQRLVLHTHAGTHMDAASHVMENGESILQIPVERLFGRCMLCRAREDVEKALTAGITKLLIADGLHEQMEYGTLAECVDLIGVEAVAVGSVETHIALLQRGVVIVEELLLSDVPAGEYYIAALPLKMDTDGAPARVILIED